MNVLHISPNYNYSCGVSKHITLLFEELSKRNDIKLFFVTNVGDSFERLRRLNIKIDLLNFKRGSKNILVLFKNYRWLKNYCKKNKIDIIHTHHRHPELISFLLSKVLPVKTITTVHSLVEGWKYASFKSDKIIAVSKSVEKLLLGKYKVPKKKIFQLYNFVIPFKDRDETEVNLLKIRLGIKESDQILLFVGRINHIKGFDVLAKAFNRLTQIMPSLKLLVVGEYETKEYKELVKNRSNIIFIPKEESVQKYYSLASIVILPSRIDPFPYVMLESGLANKPFIGGRTGGIEEFIENGIDGVLVTPGSVSELHDAIISMLSNYEDACKMGVNLSKKVASLNKAGQYCDEIVNLYKGLLNLDTPKIHF